MSEQKSTYFPGFSSTIYVEDAIRKAIWDGVEEAIQEPVVEKILPLLPGVKDGDQCITIRLHLFQGGGMDVGVASEMERDTQPDQMPSMSDMLVAMNERPSNCALYNSVGGKWWCQFWTDTYEDSEPGVVTSRSITVSTKWYDTPADAVAEAWEKTKEWRK